RTFPLRTGHEINHSADLADREEARKASRTGKERLSSPAAAQLRNASAQQRRGSANHPGDAGPRGHIDDTGLHPCRSTTAEGCASPISSARVAGETTLTAGFWPGICVERLSTIEYPACS